MGKTNKVTVNREYKDRLFKLIFRDKKDLLELYNAINNSDYDNPDEIVINTLEDVVFMGMKNDLSFLIKDVLNLYEHQSTFSPNFPLRGLFYFADLYRNIVGDNPEIYSNRLIRLPMPQFIIFYNGTKKEPERRILKLSDAFVTNKKELVPSLECTAVMININLDSHSILLNKCRRLREYAEFVGRVKNYLTQGKTIEQAVNITATECIQEGILSDILSSHRQEVKNMLMTEFNEELFLKREREWALEEGRLLILISLVRKKIQKSMSPQEIADLLEEDISIITGIYDILNTYPNLDDNAIFEEYAKKFLY